jgi:hypothetical protein
MGAIGWAIEREKVIPVPDRITANLFGVANSIAVRFPGCVLGVELNTNAKASH